MPSQPQTGRKIRVQTTGFTVQVPGDAAKLLEKLLAAGYHGGLHLGRWYPSLGNCVSIAVTEKRTKAEMDGFAAALKGTIR